MLSRSSKFEIVGDCTKEMTGILVDFGARDRVLKQFIRSSSLEYISADITQDHDLVVDLEKKLHFPDDSFDVVVALDVLEHLENIHGALCELLRIAKSKIFISLPNMTCLSFRLHFFIYGNLSGKYALLPDHQGDRHRWLTSYYQVRQFVHCTANDSRYTIRQFDILSGYGRLHSIISKLPLRADLRTYTILFELTKSP